MHIPENYLSPATQVCDGSNGSCLGTRCEKVNEELPKDKIPTSLEWEQLLLLGDVQCNQTFVAYNSMQWER